MPHTLTIRSHDCSLRLPGNTGWPLKTALYAGCRGGAHPNSENLSPAVHGEKKVSLQNATCLLDEQFVDC